MVRSTAAVLIALLLSATANAQQAAPAPVGAPTAATPIHAAIEKIQFDQGAARQLAGPSRSSHNSAASKASAGFAMGFVGMIAGAWLGAHMEGQCGCDDPGMAGALVGAPIGAIAGAFLGLWLAR